MSDEKKEFSRRRLLNMGGAGAAFVLARAAGVLGSARGVVVLGSATGSLALSRRGEAFPSGATNTTYTQHQVDTMEALGDTVIPGVTWPDTSARASRFASECATAWAAGTSYLVAQYVVANGNYYQCVSAGTSGSTAPSGTSTTIIDGSVQWQYGPALEPEDPDGQGGCVQSGVWSSFFDTAYGMNPYFPTIVSDIDSCTTGNGPVNYGLHFKYLVRKQRVAVLDWQFLNGGLLSVYAPLYQGAISLAKYNFLGGLVNATGTNYVQFPGPNTGNSVWDAAYGRYVTYASGYTAAAAQLASNPVDCPKAIPDNSVTGVTSNIAVTPPSGMASKRITNMAVTIEVDHTWIGDLKVTLYGSGGFNATLYNQNDNTTRVQNLYRTFTVPAAVGKTAGGTWSLLVQDLGYMDVGVLQTWSILFTF